MKLATLQAIFQELQAARVRYVVAGGVAVVAHGYERLTHDLDLVVQLERDNVLRAFDALTRLGYRPNVPVTAEGFADPAQRKEWIETKGMQVLNLWSNTHRDTTIDLFVTEPFDFEREYDAAVRADVAPGIQARFATIPTLIAMKQAAGRNRDADDIQHLRWILEEQQGNDT